MAVRFQYLVLVVIALIGVLFISSGLIWPDPTVKSTLMSIGTSILATAIVSVVIRLSLGDPTDALVEGIGKAQSALENLILSNVRVIERTSHTGLLSVWASRQEVSTDAWIERIKHAKKDIKLLAYAMAFLPDHPDFVDVLEERMEAGCQVYINLGDPASAAVAEREHEEHENIVPRIHTTIDRTRRLIGCPGFHLRVHASPLYVSIYLFDDELFATPHLLGLRGAAAPLLLFRRVPHGLFGKYERHFDDLWQQSTDVT